jgi:hypothetical protein
MCRTAANDPAEPNKNHLTQATGNIASEFCDAGSQYVDQRTFKRSAAVETGRS